MPAINPARLRQQADLLAQSFDQPEAFIRSLNHLFDYYADRAHRPSRAGKPSPLIKAFNVRPPVLRQLILELAPLARADGAQALALCDALWAQPYYEHHQLAALLLGQIDPKFSEGIIDRARRWLQPGAGNQTVDLVITNGLARLRQENPDQIVALVREWLETGTPLAVSQGLRLLRPLVQEARFQNIPLFFHLLQTLVRSCPQPVRPDLLDVLAELARRSPTETSYFLKQALTAPDNPDASWITRQSLQAFPEEIQQGLLAALRQAAEIRAERG